MNYERDWIRGAPHVALNLSTAGMKWTRILLGLTISGEQSNKTWQGRYRLILLCALNVLNAELVSLPKFILLKRAGAWKNV